MNEILRIDGSIVTIGIDDKDMITVPIASINYADPHVGDKVRVFRDGENVIIARANTRTGVGHDDASRQEDTSQSESSQSQEQRPRVMNAQAGTCPLAEKHMNKHVFVWVGSFLFGGIGVDRFLRGQVGLGILKLLTAGGLGVWALVDFIIALVEVYGDAFGSEEDVIFINGEYAR